MTHIVDLGYLLAMVQGTGTASGNTLVDYTQGHNEDKRYRNLTHWAALSLFLLIVEEQWHTFSQRPTFNTTEDETKDLGGEVSRRDAFIVEDHLCNKLPP